MRSYFWSVFSRIHSECVIIRTRNNSVFGHFSQCQFITNDHNSFQLWWKENLLNHREILWTWLQVPSFTLNKKFDFWDQICPKKSISNRKLKKWTSPLISEYSNYLIRINFWHGCNLAQIAQNRQIKSIPNLVFCSCARVNPRKKIFFSKFPKIS